MPLGDIIGGILGQAIWESFFHKVLVPIFRFPGAVIGWMVWRGRSLSMVWEKGDGFQQGMVGVVFYVVVALAFVAFRRA